MEDEKGVYSTDQNVPRPRGEAKREKQLWKIKAVGEKSICKWRRQTQQHLGKKTGQCDEAKFRMHDRDRSCPAFEEKEHGLETSEDK